jgi:hypothetical protein
MAAQSRAVVHLGSLQTVLLDAADAEAVGADVAAADEGSAGGKPLSEKDAAKRRHVTLMDWGAAPVVEITVRALQCAAAVAPCASTASGSCTAVVQLCEKPCRRAHNTIRLSNGDPLQKTCFVDGAATGGDDL